MMINDKKYFFMSKAEKGKTPLPNEVTPENAFIKLSISAAHAASQYKLNMLSLDDKNIKK